MPMSVMLQAKKHETFSPKCRNLSSEPNTPCTKCGYWIPPNETQRVTFTQMKCPK